MTSKGSPISVLIAESDAGRRSEIGHTLEADLRFGPVASVFDGDSAVAQSADVDVVVIDLSVAGLGCLGAISHIRQASRHAAVVGLSRPGQEWLDPVVRAEGAVDVLSWPTDRDEFCDRLARLATS